MVTPERQSFFLFLASFPSARQMVRAVLSVHDRSEPPNGPILGEPAQTNSPRPRSLPKRAHHLASAYDVASFQVSALETVQLALWKLTPRRIS